MCKVIVVTNRKLCRGDFEKQIQLLVACKVDYIVLREKDLPESEYEKLARTVLNICKGSHTICVLHQFANVAIRLQRGMGHNEINAIHLSLTDAQRYRKIRNCFTMWGISTHSIEQLREAQKACADYVFFGHVYATDCKKGLPPRGMQQLKEICQAARVPVYAIGGISAKNAMETIHAGADGVCVMSFGMQGSREEIHAFVEKIHGAK